MLGFDHYLIYAERDGQVVNIDSVKRGLKCNCVCPHCRERLIAKQGDKNIHHFAHSSGKNCEYGYESSLHLAAKEILSKSTTMVIPAVYIQLPNQEKPELLSVAKEIKIDKIELEKHFDNMIPDVVVYTGDKKFFVEIYVSHAIDSKKLEKIKKSNISTIEIDLSKQDSDVTEEALSHILLHDTPQKKWKYNSYEQKWVEKFRSVCEQKNILHDEYNVSYVKDCPRHLRNFQGESRAKFGLDCQSCPYCISVENHSVVYCSGKKKIKSIHDFDLTEEKHRGDIHDFKYEQSYICPECGEYLNYKKGKNGWFYGCSSFPICEYSASEDRLKWQPIIKKRLKRSNI